MNKLELETFVELNRMAIIAEAMAEFDKHGWANGYDVWHTYSTLEGDLSRTIDYNVNLPDDRDIISIFAYAIGEDGTVDTSIEAPVAEITVPEAYKPPILDELTHEELIQYVRNDYRHLVMLTVAEIERMRADDDEDSWIHLSKCSIQINFDQYFPDHPPVYKAVAYPSFENMNYSVLIGDFT